MVIRIKHPSNRISIHYKWYTWKPWSFDDPIFHQHTHKIMIWVALLCKKKKQSLSKKYASKSINGGVLRAAIAHCYLLWSFAHSSSSAASSYPVCSTKVIINLPYTFLLYKGIIGNDNRGIASRFREDHRRRKNGGGSLCQGEP